MKELLCLIRSDFSRNIDNPKGILIVFLFRFAHYFRCHPFKVIFFISIPYLIFYRVLVEWLLGVEIPFKTKIGPGLVVHHGMGLVVHDRCIIGANVTLRHNTTIGIKSIGAFGGVDVPVIKDNVNIGANVVIIGDVLIGDDVIIGAGTVVTKSINRGVALGNPMRIINE